VSVVISVLLVDSLRAAVRLVQAQLRGEAQLGGEQLSHRNCQKTSGVSVDCLKYLNKSVWI